jgi:response regulator of citrate/malate metabolism
MKPYNVIIVEDDFRVANIWRQFTDSLTDFHVLGETRTGEDALDFIQNNHVDLMIMDVYMPDLDGVGLLHKIRELALPLDAIAITAAKESDIVQQIIRMGVIDYIIKPCGFERFQIALRRFLKFREAFHHPELEQDKIDTLLRSSEATGSDQSRALPKGLQEITLKRVLRYFEQNPFSRSAEEISKSTGLSPATAQRYLRYMASENMIKKELTYGSQGRPEHKYSRV